jgi:NADH:ubiquinone oxidoreductase subunit 6 (subunit J)
MLTPASDRENAATAFELPALILAGCVLAVIAFVAYDTNWNTTDAPGLATTARSLGEAFLKPYVVPFEVASVLLMTAMIGAIVLARGDDDA